eukprot:4811575-Prymnesium_polylepis.1
MEAHQMSAHHIRMHECTIRVRVSAAPYLGEGERGASPERAAARAGRQAHPQAASRSRAACHIWQPRRHAGQQWCHVWQHWCNLATHGVSGYGDRAGGRREEGGRGRGL